MSSPSLPQDVEPSRFLATHVPAPKEGKPIAFFVRRGATPMVEVSVDHKIGLEVSHWVNVFLSLADPDKARSPGTRTRQSFEGMRRESIARTIRILRGLEALLLGSSVYYPKLVPHLQSDPEVTALTNKVRTISIECKRPDHDGWNVSGALLLIRAAAWSQSGWTQPYLWEAYSALYARRDHEDWLDRRAVDILAYLVRFQSAPGQFVRNTGDAQFLRSAEELQSFSQEALQLLALLAYAHDYRNRSFSQWTQLMPDRLGRTDKTETHLVNTVGCHSPDQTDWSTLWRTIRSPQSATAIREATWSHTGWLRLNETDKRQLAKFQDIVEARNKRTQPATYSFGREYRSVQQLSAMRDAVNQIVEKPEKLLQTFDFQPIQIPLWKGPGKSQDRKASTRAYETVEVIRLPARFSAFYALFSREVWASHEDLVSQAEASSSAWAIYSVLFDLAERTGFIEKGYCPTALIGRFIEIFHGIYPQDCIAVPIRINDEPPVFVYLPRVSDDLQSSWSKRADQKVRMLARYVPSHILNLIMVRDVQSCKVGLSVLKGHQDGTFWYEKTRAEIEANHFGLLLVNYLNDYRAEPSTVYLESGAPDLYPPVDPIASAPDVGLRKLLQCRDGLVLVAGIDVGGSFTKIQLYEISLSGEKIKVETLGRIKELMKLLTRFGERNGFSDPPERRIKEFAEAIKEEIEGRLNRGSQKQRIDAVGIAWPGPVRDGRIQGTSGILEKLGLTGQIVDNDIEQIMGLPLTTEIDRALSISPQGAVALVNDGDAHAWAALSELFFTGSRPKNDSVGVIVKLGTGTAGAVVTGGQLNPGLMEFGKMVVNLDYLVKKNRKFPAGVATAYVSAKALQESGDRRRAQGRQEHKLDPGLMSLEVGLIAAIRDLDAQRDGLRELQWQSGAIALDHVLKSREGDIVLDVAELNALRRWQDWTSRATKSRELCERLAILETKPEIAHKKYCERIEDYGRVRLEKIFHLTEKENREGLRLFLGGDKPSPILKHKIHRLAEEFRECVEQLGCRLADLLALISAEVGMDYVVLGGGVLSDTTGLTVLQSIEERFRQFSWINVRRATTGIADNRNLLLLVKRNKEIEGGGELFFDDPRKGNSATSLVDDYGTSGAALWGAQELLRQIRLRGLQKLTKQVQGLALLESITLEQGRVKSTYGTSKELVLSEFGLDTPAVRSYLDRSAHVLGIVRARTDHAMETYTYIRWPEV